MMKNRGQSQLIRSRLQPRHGRAFFSLGIPSRVDRSLWEIFRKWMHSPSRSTSRIWYKLPQKCNDMKESISFINSASESDSVG
ncbi:hypothetical protein Y032_0172g357 [Ancylostoma ceylanicum]|uniref:Uncharacterized protein n=1 Tax=Ancylostoma ceylanicum TaxID=53326 RepID=A0A016SVG7_9BILA|nr:hypothetical protein Y032_0172g357 [Ancylostoma ceylanicum]